MNGPDKRSLSEMVIDHDLIESAVRRAVRNAVLQHASAGNPVSSWENGQLVWLQPDEVLARLAVKQAG